MFMAANDIPMLIHLVQYVIGWGEGVVHDWKLVTKTSRSTPVVDDSIEHVLNRKSLFNRFLMVRISIAKLNWKELVLLSMS